jgi:ADP-ribose pyrophosphatase
MQLWETISRQVILHHSKYLSVESHVIRLPSGAIINDWPWVVTPDFVNVVAVTVDGEFILFRQTKYSLNDVGLAPIGGYVDPGEFPLDAAVRELKEEAGYTSDTWTHLGSYPVDGNRGAGVAHLYLAVDAVKMHDDAKTISDDLEEQEEVLLSRKEVMSAMKNKEFKVLPWAAAISLALHCLE